MEIVNRSDSDGGAFYWRWQVSLGAVSVLTIQVYRR